MTASSVHPYHEGSQSILNDMPRFFIYCRKSTEAEDRQVLSIESQRSELTRLASFRSLDVIEVLTEARSAKEPGRPIFNEMMKRLYRGEAQGVICWKLDRLARNPIDGGTVIWSMKQHGVEILTPTQSFRQADENTILMYIEFGMAQKYIEDLSRNVKRGQRAKLETGWYPTVAPLGYLNQRSLETGESRIDIDPVRFPLVKRIWEAALSGRYTPPQIWTLANDDWGFRTRRTRRLGNRPISRSTVYRILTNPFYYGWFEYPRGSGSWWKGRHTPMISEDEFRVVQTRLGRKGNPRAQKRQFPFVGLLRCGTCGAAVTAEKKEQLICAGCRTKFSLRGKERCPSCAAQIDRMPHAKRLTYTYYHCTRRKTPRCVERSVTEAQIMEQIADFLGRITIPDSLKEYAVRRAPEFCAELAAITTAVSESRQQALVETTTRLQQLLVLKTSPANIDGSLLTDEEYAVQRLTLLKRKDRLATAVLRDDRVAEARSRAVATFTLAHELRRRFERSAPEDMKSVVLEVGSNLTLQAKTVRIQAREPFSFFPESHPDSESPNGPLEPTDCRSATGRNRASARYRPTGRGERDNVRTWERIVRKVCVWIYWDLNREVFPDVSSVERFLRRQRQRKLSKAA